MGVLASQRKLHCSGIFVCGISIALHRRAQHLTDPSRECRGSYELRTQPCPRSRNIRPRQLEERRGVCYSVRLRAIRAYTCIDLEKPPSQSSTTSTIATPMSPSSPSLYDCLTSGPDCPAHISLATRYLRQELRIPFPSPNLDERVPERASPKVPRETTHTAIESPVKNIRAHRRMAAHNMPDFALQRGSRIRTGHASVVELQRLPVSRSPKGGCSRAQSK